MSLQKFSTFVVTVSSGTPVRLKSSTFLVRDALIQYHKDNANDIYVGDENVDSDAITMNAFPHAVGIGQLEQVRGTGVQVDLSSVWIATDGTSQKVVVAYIQEAQP